MKYTKEIDFLDSYWKQAKAIGQNIKQDLPNIAANVNVKKIGMLYIVPYTLLGNSWSVTDFLERVQGRSKNLIALSDKINDMILMGRADAVKGMVEKILTGRIKSLSKPVKKDIKNLKDLQGNKLNHADFLGKGHFRWNYGAYTLTETEIKRVKEYFKL